MTITFLLIAVCFLAYANGANDNFKRRRLVIRQRRGELPARLAMGESDDSGGFALFVLFRARLIAQVFRQRASAGRLWCIRSRSMSTVAGGAGATVLLATRLGFPVSTTHALLGAMIGSAVVAASEKLIFHHKGLNHRL